jgi:phytoene dehydrogenase-like protein
VSVGRFLAEHIRHVGVRRLFAALFRLSTYADDADRQSAGSALAQLQLALAGGVEYLDGGWQTLVDGLVAAARAAGVVLRTACGVDTVARGGDAAPWSVRLRDGATLAASAVVIAAPPAVAGDLRRAGLAAGARRSAPRARSRARTSPSRAPVRARHRPAALLLGPLAVAASR